MGNKVVDSTIEFIKDSDSGALVGYKLKDGTEKGIVTSDVDPVTGGIELFVAGVKVPAMSYFAEKFASLFGSRKVNLHLYGNSIVADGNNIFQTLAKMSGGRISVVQNSGVGGYTSSAVLAKIIAEGVNPLADVVAYMEGTNDAAQSVSYATHIANMRAIAQKIIQLGKIPLLVLAPPNDQAYAAVSNGMALRESVMAKTLGIAVFDPWVKLCDTDGTWISGASADLIHPLASASATAGVELYSMISGKSVPLTVPRSNVGEGLIGANVLQITDTNADGLPDGWSALSLTSPSYALSTAAYPARGKKCALTFSQAGTGYLYKEIFSGFAIGDTVRISGFAGLVSQTNAKMRVFMRFSGTPTDVEGYASAQTGEATYFEVDSVVPAGTTKIQVYVALEGQQAGAISGVAEFGCIDVYNITALTL